jgi:DNA-binding transcriptional LysR family regulator
MVFMAISPLVCKLKPPQPSIATLSVRLTVTLIASGRFVGMLPTSVAQFNAKRRLKISPIELPASWLAAGVITVKNRTHSPLGTLFVDYARNGAKSILGPTIDHRPRERQGSRQHRAAFSPCWDAVDGRGRMTTK